jgi:DNA-binding SARP family transcriptional activator
MGAPEDWASGLREETRAVYTEVARALAEDASADGHADVATRYHLRVLERDPYDESAHLVLERAADAARRGACTRRTALAWTRSESNRRRSPA